MLQIVKPISIALLFALCATAGSDDEPPSFGLSLQDLQREMDRVEGMLADQRDASALFHVRRQWPEHLPIHVTLGDILQYRLSVAPILLEVADCRDEIRFVHHVGPHVRPNPLWESPSFALPVDCVDEKGLAFQYRVRVYGRPDEDMLSGAWVKVRVPLELVPTPMQAIELCNRSSQMTKTLQRDMRLEITAADEDWIVVAVEVPELHADRSTAIAFRMELLCDDTVVAKRQYWCDSASRAELPDLPGIDRVPRTAFALIQFEVDAQRVLECAKRGNAYVLLRGDWQLALRDWLASHYWDGPLYLPLTVHSRFLNLPDEGS